MDVVGRGLRSACGCGGEAVGDEGGIAVVVLKQEDDKVGIVFVLVKEEEYM